MYITKWKYVIKNVAFGIIDDVAEMESNFLKVGLGACIQIRGA